MRRLWIAICLVVAAATPAHAGHQVGHSPPAGPAVSHFPPGFVAPADAEWGYPVGGFGGVAGDRSTHFPIVFVHGNNTDHATWYPVARRLVDEHGYRAGDLWALAYNGVGCTNDGGLFTRNDGYNGWTYQEDRAASTGCVVTANDVNVADLSSFIDAVHRYTGAEKVHIVAHSLGVTVARRTLQLNPRLFENVAGFVAIAGANHGTSFCPPGSRSVNVPYIGRVGGVHSCDEIAAGTEWLAELNGTDESPGPVRWMTVYDGTGVGDPAFAATYGQSPRLDGAANCEYPGFYHNDLRVDPRIVDDYAAFLASVETSAAFACPEPPPPLPGA